MAAFPSGTDLIVLETVDSTMSEAARRAPTLERPTWIMANQQTAARGRRGRAWSSTSGNLAASVVLFHNAPPSTVALLSFVAANALYDALALHVPAELLSLKWPNDVLLADRKVAGILLESAGHANAVAWMSIGFGVNLMSVPDVSDAVVSPTALSQHTDDPPTPEAFLNDLAAAYATHEAQFGSLGFGPVRELWLSRAARLGEVITARTTSNETAGTFKTIDDDGQLVLQTAGGAVRIAAADVYF